MKYGTFQKDIIYKKLNCDGILKFESKIKITRFV